MHISLPTCKQHIELSPSSYRAFESSICWGLNQVNCQGENSVACFNLIISACLGLAFISYWSTQKTWKFFLSVASPHTYILQRSKAVLYSPIRDAFAGQGKFTSFMENTQYLPDTKKERYRIGRAMTIEPRKASCLHLYLYIFHTAAMKSIYAYMQCSLLLTLPTTL